MEKEIPIYATISSQSGSPSRPATTKGEARQNLNKIEEAIKSTNAEAVTVQEFVGLVSPYTSDNGKTLSAVMVEDLEFFRNMAKRVYETMAQDVSDVLTNKQKQLLDKYQEASLLCADKTMKAIDEIYQYSQNFDFEQYYKNPDYLMQMFPLPQDALEDSEEIEAQKRQEAYHRLQWLRAERERLAEENLKLENRLQSMKTVQHLERISGHRNEFSYEKQNLELETTHAQLQNKLQDLNDNLERQLVKSENVFRKVDSIISQSSSRVLSQSRLSSRTDQRRDEKRGVKSTKGQRNRKFELEAKIEDSQIAQNLDRTTSPNSIQFLDYFSTSKRHCNLCAGRTCVKSTRM